MTEQKDHLISAGDSENNLEYLESVAVIRFVLLCVTEQLVARNLQKGDDHSIFADLLALVKDLCGEKAVNTTSYGPQTFLLKNLFRRCGEVDFNKIINECAMKWILPEGRRNDVRLSVDDFLTIIAIYAQSRSNQLVDYFAIYGTEYIHLRKDVINKLNSQNVTDFEVRRK